MDVIVFVLVLCSFCMSNKIAIGMTIHSKKIPISICNGVDSSISHEFLCRRSLLLTTASTATMLLTSNSKVYPTNAITPEEASRSYNTYAKSYDALDGGVAASALGIESARAELLQSANGRVLEVGSGTGLNLPWYNFRKNNDSSNNGVTSLTLVDVSEGMLQQAKSRVDEIALPSGVKVEMKLVDATSQLVETFGRNSFDTVIDTFSLCVMGNEGARKCLSEMKNIVTNKQNGGRILLLENTRADNSLLGWYQDITAETAASLGGKGCLYNQDVRSFILKSGLQIEKEISFSSGIFRSFVCYWE